MSSSSSGHVRLMYDYRNESADDVEELFRGDECVVICDNDVLWLYVSKLGHCTRPMYVPRTFVEPVHVTSSAQSLVPDNWSRPLEEDVTRCKPAGSVNLARSQSQQVSRAVKDADTGQGHQLYAAMTRHQSVNNDSMSSQGQTKSGGWKRSRAASTLTSTFDDAHVTRGSFIDEATDSDDEDDSGSCKSDYIEFNPADLPPLPSPPTYSTSSRLGLPVDSERTTSRGRVQSASGADFSQHSGQLRDDKRQRQTPLVRELSLRCSISNSASPSFTGDMLSVNTDVTTCSSSNNTLKLPASTNGSSSSGVSPAAVSPKSAPPLARTLSHNVVSPPPPASDDRTVDSPVFSYSRTNRLQEDRRSSVPVRSNTLQQAVPPLLDKEGPVQCRHSRENGKLVPRQEWTNTYLVLTGAIISFYKNEAATRKKSDGHYSMPDSSIVLQGASVQMTGRDQHTLDIVLITSATNTQYFIQTCSVDETQSWCYHVKHNIAVLLAERNARMQHAKPVSTLAVQSSCGPPSISPRSRGVLTIFESEMSRIAQLLRDLLSRRPTREDLQNRGIYQEPLFGSSLSAVCMKDNSKVPLFLVSCFQEIERRGMDMAGVYRHSGSVSQIQKLRIQANQCEYDVSTYDIHVLTGAVKLFFRELPEPVIPVNLLDQFISAYGVSDEQRKRTELTALIQQLPAEHRHTLVDLLVHLERVAERSDENQMSAHNLAIVFGPTLMWSATPSEQSLSTTVVVQGKLVEYFISDRTKLFLS